MTTSDRSVEEIVEEVVNDYFSTSPSYRGRNAMRILLTQTLQAERQKREEAYDKGWNEGARYVEQNMAGVAKASEEHGYHQGFNDGR